jgi:hypothetical protein
MAERAYVSQDITEVVWTPLKRVHASQSITEVIWTPLKRVSGSQLVVEVIWEQTSDKRTLTTLGAG